MDLASLFIIQQHTAWRSESQIKMNYECRISKEPFFLNSIRHDF